MKISRAAASLAGRSSRAIGPRNCRAFGSKSQSDLLHSLSDMSDDEVVDMVEQGSIPVYKLEEELKTSVESGADPDCTRATRIRRKWLRRRLAEQSPNPDADIEELPNIVREMMLPAAD